LAIAIISTSFILVQNVANLSWYHHYRDILFIYQSWYDIPISLSSTI